LGKTGTEIGAWFRQSPTECRRLRAISAVRATSEFRPFKFDVLRIEGGVIGEITTFGAGLFPAFGLPAKL
jgi:RNA polymerase sigma-70 factor (ECF subfamily)